VIRNALLLGLVVALSACSVLDDEKIDYKSASRGQSLAVPPDLTQLSADTRYNLGPADVVSAKGFEARQASAPAFAKTAPNQIGDVQFKRDGNTFWLVVNRPADQLWDPVRDFWLANGFLLTIDERNLGIMETDWAENRAKLPQDIIRRTLGKVLDSVYDTSQRDKFRTRMEHRPDGKTEIFVSHRGMEEVYTSDSRVNGTTVWQPRPENPELEAEFLRRMMVKLGGATTEEAKAAQAEAAAVPVKSGVSLATVSGVPTVKMNESFDRAWRRVGLTLDRTGFTVVDRDRSKGLYFVRYVKIDADRKPQGFFGKLLQRKPDAPAPVQYRIAVRSQADNTTDVTVLDASGNAMNNVDAGRIVKVIADDLK
jgi:outer membrane protein assembly factor BamC